MKGETGGTEADAILCARALHACVSENPEDRPDRPSLARALVTVGAKRNAAIGLLVGSLFAAMLLVVFVLPGETQESPLLYLGLAGVVAVTTGMLIAVVLTARSAVRVSREIEEG